MLYLDSQVKGSLQAEATRMALETLATEAAVAIENARLYRQAQEKARQDEELRMASEFQQALLPKAAPARPYFDAAAAMVPCLAIGGDFYDYLDMTDEFGFNVGDVSGKGASAGPLGARVQEIFAARASLADGPAQTIARVNQALFKRSLLTSFVTVVYGTLSPSGRLRYCNAGHNPPLLVGKTGI